MYIYYINLLVSSYHPLNALEQVGHSKQQGGHSEQHNGHSEQQD